MSIYKPSTQFYKVVRDGEIRQWPFACVNWLLYVMCDSKVFSCIKYAIPSQVCNFMSKSCMQYLRFYNSWPIIMNMHSRFIITTMRTAVRLRWPDGLVKRSTQQLTVVFRETDRCHALAVSSLKTSQALTRQYLPHLHSASDLLITSNVTGHHRGPKRRLRVGYRATSQQLVSECCH